MFFSAGLFAESNPEKGFNIRSNFHYENYSFFKPSAFGGNVQLAYNKKSDFGVRGGMYFLNKFNNNVPGFTLGGTYFITPEATLSLDADFGINAVVVPIQGYTLEGAYTFIHAITPSLSYRFAQYSQAIVNIIAPGILGKFEKYYELKGKAYIAFTTFPLRKETVPTFSFMVNLLVTPIEQFAFSVGYALDSEAFDPGNPELPIGGYLGHDILVGLYPVLYGPLSLAINGNYEFRSNGFRVFTLDAGVVFSF